MTYGRALTWFRYFIADTGGGAIHPAVRKQYTLHSMKSTILSWSHQLNLPPEGRLVQGHHKSPQLASCRLYSRDDVHGSLMLQRFICSSVQKGWRPATPLHRGGQAPLSDPAVDLQLPSLLADFNGSLELFHRVPPMHVHNLAIAICRGAHLATLNTYKNRFMQLLSARFEQSSGLRAPSLQEAQQADQRLWQQVGKLVTDKGWKLDDAIYEFAVLRPDMQALLQPRCKPVILAHPGNSFATSSSRKGGKAQGKGKKSAKGPAGPRRPGLNSQQWIAEVVKDGRRHTLCMQWNAGRCSMAQCNFLHACAYPKADGVACAGSHAARDHASASH